MSSQQEKAFIADTPDAVSYFRFASIKQQLKLEQVGLKSSGGALRPRLAKEFNLKPKAPHADYIAYCESQLTILRARKPADNS